ncbi:DNA helicase [Tanacetum coccineum]
MKTKRKLVPKSIPIVGDHAIVFSTVVDRVSNVDSNVSTKRQCLCGSNSISSVAARVGPSGIQSVVPVNANVLSYAGTGYSSPISRTVDANVLANTSTSQPGPTLEGCGTLPVVGTHSGAISKKYEDYCSDNQYAVSIKKDTAYPCLHFTKDHEGNKIQYAVINHQLHLCFLQSERVTPNVNSCLRARRDRTRQNSATTVNELNQELPESGPPSEYKHIDNEVDNRLTHFRGDNSVLHRDIVEGLIDLLDTHNVLVQLFRTTREKFQDNHIPNFKVRLYNVIGAREYELPTGDMLGAIVYKTGPDNDVDYDIMLEIRSDGYSKDLKMAGSSGSSSKDKQLTMLADYSYYLHERANRYNYLSRTGKLFQQYVVTAFCAIEQNRIDFIREHQNDIRNDYLSGIYDAINRGDNDGSHCGSKRILPADVVDRVFEMKIHEFVNYLRDTKPFGKVVAEWEVTLEEDALTATPAELRALLAHILANNQVLDPKWLWKRAWKNFGLRPPPEYLMSVLRNRLLMEEKSYDRQLLAVKRDQLFPMLNENKRRAFWSLNEDILKIIILKTNTPYPSRKIRRIRACTHQRPQKNKTQYAVSRETQYVIFKIWNEYNILEDIKRGPYSKKSPIHRKIVLAVASYGIASLLPSAGRTAYSRFKIPLDVTDTSWLLDIGNGKIGTPDDSDPDNTSWIDIPNKYSIPNDENRITNLIDFIYDDDTLHHPSARKFQKKAIIYPKNNVVDLINAKFLSLLTTTTRTYLSYNDATLHGHDGGEVELLYLKEYLNSLSFAGLPPHKLTLKVAGFLDSGGGGGKKKKKNNSNDSPINTVMESADGDELNEVLRTTLDSEDTMNDDSPSGVASKVREGVTPSMDDTTIPGSFPPLSTPVSTTTGNAPGKSSYANITGKPSGKKVNVRTLFTPGGNGIDVVVPVDSIRAISECFANTAYGFFLGKKVAYLVVANYVRNT